jgi:nucleotidyltransferase/DNA polymerase involved in DNA repair
MACDLNKPNGQAVITPCMGPSFVEALPVKKFHGVGPATAEKMQRLGIETGADLKAKSLHFLREHFGKSGVWYYRVARGIDERPVEPDRPRKSVGAEDTFVTDIFEMAAARAELRPLVAKIWGHCEAKGLHAPGSGRPPLTEFGEVGRRTGIRIADRRKTLDWARLSDGVREMAAVGAVTTMKSGVRKPIFIFSCFECTAPDPPGSRPARPRYI